MNISIIGVGLTEIKSHWDADSATLANRAIREALRDANLEAKNIDGIVTTPQGYFTDAKDIDRFAPQRMGEYLNLNAKVQAAIDIGGMSSLAAVKYGAYEILLEKCRTVLIYASEKLLTRDTFDISRHIYLTYIVNGLFGPYDRRYGVMRAAPYYAMATQRYMHEYHITKEQIAQVPVVLRENASLNLRAQFREPITVEDVLNSRPACPPLNLLDCCPVSEGAAAIILADQKTAREIGREECYLAGIGEAHDPTSFFPIYQSVTEIPSLRRATQEALKQAKTELKDLDVAEVYGPFSGTELMVYEEMGFYKRGEAPKAVEEGRTKISGETPVNPSGGRLSLGHPPYVTPLAEIHEIVTQLRGEANKRQVQDAETGLVHAEHGMMNGNMVAIIKRR
ncbi:MAG: thiolase family protein [Candidatus Jordarchaeum sp.]|uniref:thiolase family protein n=1 Tax=Candidatus Jordarchaeum sp. TaxID=2823881 RepID=UPI00404AC428